MQVLLDTTFSGKNISSVISVYEYTALANASIRVQVRLASVAGGGDYIAHITLNDGDAQSDDAIGPRTTYTAAAGETAFWFASVTIDVMAGDVINIMVLGQAGDTNESGSVRIFADNYAVAGDAMDLVADAVDSAALAANAITEIDAVLTASHGAGAWTDSAGAGSEEFVYTLTDDVTLLPIADALIWVTTDIAGVNIVASGYTDNFGQVTYYLDPGTYYLWRKKAGYNFSNPDVEVIV